MATISRPPVAPMPSISPSATPESNLGPLTPTSDQVVVLYVIIAMSVVIFGFWNVPIVRNFINPLKLFTIGWHELCHITAAILSGGRILKITIDPHVGGATIVEGGSPWFTLTAGYVGSTLLGGAFVLAGWNTLVAKILSFVLGVGLIIPLVLVRDKIYGHWVLVYRSWTSSTVVVSVYWRYEVSFGKSLLARRVAQSGLLGPGSILFVIWDVADDRFFHKTNDSDATQFSLLFPKIGAHIWATFWILFQLAFLAGFCLLGIYAFKTLGEHEITADDERRDGCTSW
ncbi:hypothetical protein CC1G_09030 [Coprinopsis cinerea okayama7|uniref:Peptidase M50B-like-domain-containing protein n=1 Tax=Coprinopsis cinerea (strain Okayama-7 / 130 / ATCC MYA-4618 / FGSC 9003) TaxID=240176 RepID=A8N9J5_COPC7|nr:hypothetical protein CC1G_09030 [Coprinopsis cinerea okayama7\|eukprot:XP_001831501.2 hypothetical protein CC1G_09030 [Coprinopsis cinerea okayama7\